MEHDEDILTKEEALTLLKYMADHNLHHAVELRETLPALSVKTSETVEKAAKLMEESASLIIKAIEESEN